MNEMRQRCARIMNSVDLHESESYRKSRQKEVHDSRIFLSLLSSKHLSVTGRERERERSGVAKVQKTETRNSRTRAGGISGHGRA